tara:strand:+ start:629 stop:904 length:276 start_codon:yes stop_codon:yes gene_type:complete
VLGILEILTTTSFYISSQIIPGPEVTSFIGTLFPVILTGMRIVFVHECFTWLELFGVLHGRPFWIERIGYVLITWMICFFDVVEYFFSGSF